MRGNKGLWVVLAAACVATLLAAVVVPVAPHVDDMRRLLSGARSLAEGKPPGDVLAAYRLSHAGKRFLAGLVAGVSMSRPLGAVAVIAGLFRGEGRRHALGFGLGVLIFVGMTLGVAFVWDHNLVHDILVAGVRRPLVG